MIALSVGVVGVPVGLATSPILIPAASIAFAVAYSTGNI